MLSFLLRVPIIVGLVWLIMQIKPLKTLARKKKRLSIIITGLIVWFIVAAVPFEYNIFKFKTPESAIYYSMREPEPFHVVGSVDNGDKGTYFIIEKRIGCDSYYLKKAGEKWRMQYPYRKFVRKIAGYDFGSIEYFHYSKDELVFVKYFFTYTDKTNSNYQITDNKGTIFQSYMYPSVSGKVSILFYGLYTYDNLPYELYLNGETAFTYNDE